MALLRQVGLGRPMTRAEFDENMNEFPNKFATIAALKAATWLQVGQVVAVEEYHAGIGGGMLFGRIVAGGTGTDDGGSYIDLAASGLQFEQNFSDYLSPNMFGAKGDGVTDDTLALRAMRNYHEATNLPVFWTDNDFLTSNDVNGVIARLHEIESYGPGRIKRGGDTFYMENKAGQTNIIYVDPASVLVDTDGLSPATAMSSLQNAFDTLKEYGPNLEGVWRVRLAAGTYTEANTGFNVILNDVKSVERVIIEGPNVGGHPNIPTAIFDGTQAIAADYEHGIRCSGIGLKVQVNDIKFINFTSNSTRIGLVGESECDLSTSNIHADNCDWTGIYAFNTIRARLKGGILNACRSGFIANDTQATIGTLAAPTIVSNSTEYGIYWSRGSQGHVDYVVFEDNAVGLLVAENSRVDTIQNTYKRNTVGIRTQTGGVYGEGGVTNNVFGTGVDANGTDIEYKAFSGDTTELRSAESHTRLAYDRTTRSHSGLGAADVVTVYTIPAGRLAGSGKTCKVTFWATLTAVTAGSKIGVKFGGMVLNITAPSAASNLTAKFEFDLHEVAGGYRAFGSWMQGVNQFRMAQASGGFDKTINQDVTITANLSDAGDSILIYRTDVQVVG